MVEEAPRLASKPPESRVTAARDCPTLLRLMVAPLPARRDRTLLPAEVLRLTMPAVALIDAPADQFWAELMLSVPESVLRRVPLPVRVDVEEKVTGELAEASMVVT